MQQHQCKPLLVYLMGPTCAGKGTLVELLKEVYGNTLGLVEVGKAFRAKYPPSYFAGQANPAHTMKEALSMYYEFMVQEIAANKRLIVIDGQPRQGQVDPILDSYRDNTKIFIHLDAAVDIRRGRVTQRFTDPTCEAAELSFKRLDNDRITYYDVLVNLLINNRFIKVINTDRPVPQWSSAALEYISSNL